MTLRAGQARTKPVDELTAAEVRDMTVCISWGDHCDAVYLAIDEDPENKGGSLLFTIKHPVESFTGSELLEITSRIQRVISMEAEIRAFWHKLAAAANGDEESQVDN